MKSSSEKDLKGWWEWRLPLREPLLAAQGERFQVLHRGRPNGAGGPDYLDTVLRLEGGELLRGAVELHRRSQDWWHHGHQHDARYLGVVLHGVGDPSGHQLVLANGRVPLTLDLPFLLSKAVAQAHTELCFGVWERWGEKRCLQVLDEQGDQRFREKAQTFSLALRRTDRDQVLYEGLLMGLGYSQNQAPFRQLAQRLPLTAVKRYIQDQNSWKREITLEALFLGSAGLLQLSHATRSDPAIGGETRSEAERWAWWRTHGGRPLVERALWRFDGVRPGNLPTQRLTAAARLVAQWGTSGWVDRAWQVLRDGFLEKGPSRLISNLQEASETLGQGTAAVLVVNVILPLLHADAERRKQLDLQPWPQEAYRHCPSLPTNSITRLMESRLRGEAIRLGRLSRNARQHQGLIRLYKAFCTQGCGSGCPFWDGQG